MNCEPVCILSLIISSILVVMLIFIDDKYTCLKKEVTVYKHVLINNGLATYTVDIDGKVKFEVIK